MRTKVIVSALAAVALAFAVCFAPASAGEPFSLEVIKVVEGPVPPGTTFTIQVACEARNGQVPQDLVFGEQGGTQTVQVNFGDVCTVTETDDGGAASVTYACESNVQSGCQPDGQTVDFGVDDGGQDAQVTVTDTFVAEEAPAEAVPAEAEPVTADPGFTG